MKINSHWSAINALVPPSKLLMWCIIALLLLFPFTSVLRASAPAPPGDPSPNVELDAWQFANTNWFSGGGYSPIGFTNLVNVTNGDGNCLLLDTTNVTPAFLLYKTIETGGFTNLITTNGSISLWLKPTWSSTNQGGTGPGNWGNIVSAGYTGTNGPWWAWYLSPDGCTAYFSVQTSGGTSSNCLVAPVSFVGTNWYNLVLTYGPTNTAFYTNGVLVTNGTGVVQSELGVTFFAIGSDTNGFYQARAMFDDLTTFNYQLDPSSVQGTFGMYSIFYGLAGAFSLDIISAPSTNTATPLFNAVTGAGFLVGTGSSPTYSTSSNIWFTNWSTTFPSSNVINLNFAVAGGSNGVPYDVFATTALVTPVTNGVWYWMGQAYRGTNYSLPITNYSPGNVFLLLGKPGDSDLDGLSDIFERLITHTDPFNPDSDYDGRSDGHEFVDGTNPLLASSVNSVMMASWSFDNTNTWVGDQGQVPLMASNVVGIASWSSNAVQITAAGAILNYREVETNGPINGNANINCQRGTASFWFKSLWNSGTGPGSTGRFLEIGSESSGGWWGIVANSTGTTLSLITETNSVETVNATAPIDWIYTGWHQVVVTYSPTNSSIYLDGTPVITNGLGITSYPNASLRASGLRIGSDINGNQQASGIFESLAIYNYPLSAGTVSSTYATEALLLPVDLDFDGLDAAAETLAGTSPTSPDSDGDGLSDWYEINISHTNPLSAQPVPSLTDRAINRCPEN